MPLVLDEHRQYLEDEHRVSAFRAAIAKTIRPGDIVLDLGCGTGILGLLAAQAGAARVYSVDDGAIIQVARDVARANHLADRIVHIRGFSRHIDLPEKADVLIADQSGRFGFEAGVVQYFTDALLREPPHRAVLPLADGRFSLAVFTGSDLVARLWTHCAYGCLRCIGGQRLS